MCAFGKYGRDAVPVGGSAGDGMPCGSGGEWLIVLVRVDGWTGCYHGHRVWLSVAEMGATIGYGVQWLRSLGCLCVG